MSKLKPTESTNKVVRAITRANLDILYLEHIVLTHEYSRRELAELLNVSVNYVSRMISGNLPLTFVVQRKLEEHTGITIEQFCMRLEKEGFVEHYETISKNRFLIENLTNLFKRL